MAAMRGDEVDEDWLGRTLRGEEIGGYIPVGHANSLRVWEAVEYYSWGWPVEDVADEIGMSKEGVFVWFRRAKIQRRPPYSSHRRPPSPWWQPDPWWQLYDRALRQQLQASPRPTARVCATSGMVSAYNAGLSIREMTELWHTFRFGGIYKRLANSGVVMRGRSSRSKVPDSRTIEYYRQVAGGELAHLGKNPAKRASPGMIRAYNAGLSLRIMSTLWGGLSPSSIHNRLRAAGVTMRSSAEATKSKPSQQLVDQFRQVARIELSEGSQKGPRRSTRGHDDIGERRGPLGGPAEGMRRSVSNGWEEVESR